MSTKATIKYSDKLNYHLYNEVGDHYHVYLTVPTHLLEDANRHEVTLKIPVEIWESIRGHNSIDYQYAGKSDQELADIVTNHIKERKGLDQTYKFSFLLDMHYWHLGDSTATEEEQFNTGLAYLKALRGKQEEILSRIEKD